MTAFTVQINCGSGMQSIDTAYQYIREGQSDLILAGGTDALSYLLIFARARSTGTRSPPHAMRGRAQGDRRLPAVVPRP
jgi:acetyl-CoA acetyltransferase